jgi:hypothetical protein
MQHEPSSFVRNAHHSAERQGANAAHIRAGHKVNGEKPPDKAGAAAFHDSSGSKRSLMTAKLAFEQRQLAGRRHIYKVAIASGTAKSMRPFYSKERFRAGRFGAILTLKFIKVNCEVHTIRLQKRCYVLIIPNICSFVNTFCKNITYRARLLLPSYYRLFDFSILIEGNYIQKGTDGGRTLKTERRG